MVYLRCGFEDEGEYSILVGSYHEGYTEKEDGTIVPVFDDHIPAWSLVALLEEIPEVINFDDDENDYALKIFKESGLYYLSYGNPLENGKVEIEAQENFVDACYWMILKLHELKML